jgi:hypothetical protein
MCVSINNICEHYPTCMRLAREEYDRIHDKLYSTGAVHFPYAREYYESELARLFKIFDPAPL